MSLADDISNWIRTTVHEARMGGIVVGLSGGVDSAVVAALGQRGMPGRVLGVILPCESDPQDAEDAQAVAAALDIELDEADLTPAFRAMADALPTANPTVTANLKPRLRMAALYHFAATRRYLVAGTSNRSEYTLGYFTKHGDSACDLMPIASLLKFEVLQLARELAVPQRIIDKPPSAGLRPGQTDEEDLGLSYGQIDLALRAMTSQGTAAIPGPAFSQVKEMMRASAHKRNLPPMFVPRRD
jgi:NAD+ synthase